MKTRERKGNQRSAVVLLLGALLATSLSSCATTSLPGVGHRERNCYLIENHSSAYIVWHANNVTNATLVHLDTHDDCRHRPPEAL